MSNPTNTPIVLGITGGIGSGKSYISRLLNDTFDIPVYDTDTNAKQLTATSPTIRKALQQLIGENVYKNDGSLNKTVLADYLFANDTHATQVNAIIHPEVRLHFCQWVKRQSVPVVAIESAILFESGFNHLAHRIIYIDAPESIRLQRAMERDGASAKKIQERMNRQQAQSYSQQAHYVLQNHGTTDSQLTELLRSIITEIYTISDTIKNQ